mgnify:FL=1
MTIDNTIVKRVGNLAKIKIKESEEKKLIQELNNILDWVDELKKVDTSGVEPMLSVFNESMQMREDKVEQNFSSELVTKNSPEEQSGFFVVPKVVE